MFIFIVHIFTPSCFPNYLLYLCTPFSKSLLHHCSWLVVCLFFLICRHASPQNAERCLRRSLAFGDGTHNDMSDTELTISTRGGDRVPSQNNQRRTHVKRHMQKAHVKCMMHHPSVANSSSFPLRPFSPGAACRPSYAPGNWWGNCESHSHIGRCVLFGPLSFCYSRRLAIVTAGA